MLAIKKCHRSQVSEIYKAHWGIDVEQNEGRADGSEKDNVKWASDS